MLTPEMALRNIEQMFAELDTTPTMRAAIEVDLARIWDYVLLGK